jgi:hypothetical protein
MQWPSLGIRLGRFVAASAQRAAHIDQGDGCHLIVELGHHRRQQDSGEADKGFHATSASHLGKAVSMSVLAPGSSV